MEVFPYKGTSRHLKFANADDFNAFQAEYRPAVEESRELGQEVIRRWFPRGGIDGETAVRPDGRERPPSV